jgi:hypothetical protein
MDAAGGAKRLSPLRQWLRKLGHAAAAAGLAGILAFLAVFVRELAAGPSVSFGEGLRLFFMVMPAALFAPIAGTLPILALGLLVQRSWRGPVPLALWASAGAGAGLIISLALAKSAALHAPAAALGAFTILVFGWLDREEALAHG